MKAAFTPGPWACTQSICNGDVSFDIHQVEIDGKWVPGSDIAYTTLFRTYVSEHGDIQVANARLIANAPCLLKRLQAAVNALDRLTDRVDGTGFSKSDVFTNALDEIDLCNAAIAKATGVAA